jgi:hypothetical protein
VLVLSIVFGIVGAVGGLFGIGSFLYARQGVRLMKADIARRNLQDADDSDWASRLESVVDQLRRINPQMMVQPPGETGLTMLYPTIFPNPKFRVEIETYIVHLDASRTQFVPISRQAYELRSSTLRATLAKAEILLQEFRQAHPNMARYLDPP